MLLKSGKDPNLEKKKLKSNAVLDQGNSFGSISEEWFERMQHEWSEDYFHDSKRAFELHVLPYLKEIPISEIDHAEVKSVLSRMEEQKKFVAAKKVLQKLDRIFRFAYRNDYCKHNPVILLKNDIITPKKKNQPALEESDLPEFLKKLDGHYDQRGLRNARSIQFGVWIPERYACLHLFKEKSSYYGQLIFCNCKISFISWQQINVMIRSRFSFYK